MLCERHLVESPLKGQTLLSLPEMTSSSNDDDTRPPLAGDSGNSETVNTFGGAFIWMISWWGYVKHYNAIMNVSVSVKNAIDCNDTFMVQYEDAVSHHRMETLFKLLTRYLDCLRSCYTDGWRLHEEAMMRATMLTFAFWHQMVLWNMWRGHKIVLKHSGGWW